MKKFARPSVIISDQTYFEPYPEKLVDMKDTGK